MNVREDQASDRAADAAEGLRFNVPNTFCVLRLAGSLVLVAVALGERPVPFLLLFLLLAFTDWIDGRLAAWLGQQTTFGARIDSVADAAMYTALLFGCVWLKGDELMAEAAWIGTALASYAFSCTAALVKFGRLPSHHTYSAKVAAVLTLCAAVALLADWTIWPLRLATIAVTLANLESTVITLLSVEWKSDVHTAWHAIRQH